MHIDGSRMILRTMPAVALVAIAGAGVSVAERAKIVLSDNWYVKQLEGVRGAVFEDNFFDMPPGQKRAIDVIDAAGGRKVTVQALGADPIRLEMK